jgi:RHS repeat-associated protein
MSVTLTRVGASILLVNAKCFQYKNSVLQFFPTAEGYVRNTSTNPAVYNFQYVFNYLDHLGNVRVSYAKNPTTNKVEILEENNYYPFGLKHQGYNTDNLQPDYKYKYNGKELQDELGLNMYDFGARNYDPAIGRWMNIDPLAEMSRRFSPYTYALNNPVYFIDPDGMMQAPHGANDIDNKGLTPTPQMSLFSKGRPEYWAGDGSSSDIDPSKKGEGTDTGNAQYVGKDGLPNGVDLPPVGLNEVVISGYKSQSYFQGYYDSYKYINGENPYSPYFQDGLGITISGSVSYNYTTYSASFSLVANEEGKLGGFLTFGSGISTSRLGGGLGVSLDAYDTYGGATIFEGLKDYARGASIGFKYLGLSHSQSVLVDKGQYITNDKAGVVTNSLFLNLNTKLSPVPSSGGSLSVTNTKRLF